MIFYFLVGTKPYKNIKMKSTQKSKQNNSSKVERRSELSNLTFYCFFLIYFFAKNLLTVK